MGRGVTHGGKEGAPSPTGASAQLRRDPATWRRELVDADHFRREQARLRGVWTLIGLATELRRNGDWIARDLWGHSVFVQRFGETLRGFENFCAHRFYPLRHGDKGNGPVRCGFHGWRYDQDGVAVSIPMCREMFGCAPRELDARLKPVEIAVCGSLIFGRIPADGARETLADYLGAMEPILRVLTAEASSPQRLDRAAEANWKLSYYIALDDYHIAAVHPSTFGARGNMGRDIFHYYRAGLHSAMMAGHDLDDGALAAMSAACREGRYEPADYRFFQIFPNLVVVHLRRLGRWYVLVMQYLAPAVDRTLVRTWIFPVSLALTRSPAERAWDVVLDHPRAVLMRFGTDIVVGEDNAICARLQSLADQPRGLPILGAEEERIAWFDEAYARVMAER
jgi:phenylpropionate dioxygenase-like ring-hydroxylating dioxygenase large terminal subunit